MEKNFVTLDEAMSTFANSSWTKSPIVGSRIPEGDYRLGAIGEGEFEQDDVTRNYPTIVVEGHGTITGRSIMGSAVKLPKNKAIVKSARTGGYYIQSEPFNKQYSGIPIEALVELQGKRVHLKPIDIKVQVQFPKQGEKWEGEAGKKLAEESYDNLADKTAYSIVVINETIKEEAV